MSGNRLAKEEGTGAIAPMKGLEMKCECGGELERDESRMIPEEELLGIAIPPLECSGWFCNECGEVEMSSDDLEKWSVKVNEAYREETGREPEWSK